MSNVQRELLDLGMQETRKINGHLVRRTPGASWWVDGKHCATLTEATTAVEGTCLTN